MACMLFSRPALSIRGKTPLRSIYRGQEPLFDTGGLGASQSRFGCSPRETPEPQLQPDAIRIGSLRCGQQLPSAVLDEARSGSEIFVRRKKAADNKSRSRERR